MSIVKTIFLDLGHGQGNTGNSRVYDSGAVGGGTCEADVVYRIGEIGAEVLADYQVQVERSRPTRLAHMPLLYRAPLAQSVKADCFISIHLNAGQPAATGTEVFTAYGKDLELAKTVHSAALGAFGLVDRGIKDESQSPRKVLYVLHNVRQVGSRMVLSAYKIPGCLLEVGFISNTGDLKAIQNETKVRDFFHRLAKGLGLEAKVKTSAPVNQTLQRTPVLNDVSWWLDSDVLNQADGSQIKTPFGVLVSKRGRKVTSRAATAAERDAVKGANA